MKVKPPMPALAEKVRLRRPAPAKDAVATGTALFGDQLPAVLKLLVSPFQVASCARAAGARERPIKSNAG